MEENRYQVLVTAIDGGLASRWQAIQFFAHLFSISEDEADVRLKALPCVVRGCLSLDQAQKYCRVMRRQGIGCELLLQESA